MNNSKLQIVDFQEAAQRLGCEVSDIMAFAAVEAPKGGFTLGGHPTVLFERHHFSRLTGGKYNATHPHLSNRLPGGYRKGDAEWARYQDAARLDARAAAMACSWGRFQIMGFNFKLAGFDTLDAFLVAMHDSERAQLQAFVSFILNSGLDDELREEDYAALARGYNGKNYHINQYDTRLAAADRKYERAGVDNNPLARTSEDRLDAQAAQNAPMAPAPSPQPEPPSIWTADGFEAKAAQVETAMGSVTKRVDSIKAFRIAMGMKGAGLLAILEGFWTNNKPFVWLGVSVVILFAILYFLRQWHLGAIQVKK